MGEIPIGAGRRPVEYKLTFVAGLLLSMAEKDQEAVAVGMELKDGALKAPPKLCCDLIIELSTKAKIEAEERGRLEAGLDADALDRWGGIGPS